MTVLFLFSTSWLPNVKQILLLIFFFLKSHRYTPVPNFKSCHPTHTKRKIPYNLARRVCSIVTEENIRNQRLEELNVFLSAQNYPEKLILSAIETAKKIPQEIFRTTRKNVKDPYLIPFVTTTIPNM